MINCTKEEHFIVEAKMIVNKLRERKYPESILEQAILKIQEVTGEQLLELRIKKEDQRIRYNMTLTHLIQVWRTSVWNIYTYYPEWREIQ